MNVGVLALQGDFLQHVRMLNEAASVMKLDLRVHFVKKPEDIDKIHGLIIPGGESTTIGTLMKYSGVDEAIVKAYEEGNLAIFATCAGLILLAKDIADSVVGETSQNRLGLLDISVIRNAFGRQKDSFEAPVMLTEPFITRIKQINEKYSVRLPLDSIANGVFIRAPVIADARDNTIIATLHDDRIVGVMNDRIIALAFHPELTDDLRFHAAFLDMVNSLRVFSLNR